MRENKEERTAVIQMGAEGGMESVYILEVEVSRLSDAIDVRFE